MISTARALAALALLASLPALAFLAGRPRPLPPADFTFVLPNENSTIDPAQARSVSDGWIVLALFDPLTRPDPTTLEPEPLAASSFFASDDGRTWTFRLDPAGRWSDGEPVRAEDFVYAWNRVLDPETACGFAELLFAVEGARPIAEGRDRGPARGLLAPDPHTFVIRLEYPVWYFPSLAAHFALAPVRRDLLERHGDHWTAIERMVGNGSYRAVKRRVRDRVRLARNPHHPRYARTAFDVIDALVLDEPATALNLYLTGAVDWINAIPSHTLDALRGRRDLHLSPVLATNFLRVNVTRPPFDDVRVRRALDRALDRAALVEYVYRGAEQPAHSLVPPSLAGYQPPHGPQEDPDAARALLAEAGFPDGRGFPEFELLHAAGDQNARVAEAIARRWRDELSVRARPAPQEFKVYIDSQNTLRYSVCLASWIGDFPDASNFLSIFRTGAASNRTGYSDPAYDSALDLAERASGAKRLERLRRAEAILLERGPIIPVAYRGQPNLVREDIRGFTGNLLDLHPLDLLSRGRP